MREVFAQLAQPVKIAYVNACADELDDAAAALSQLAPFSADEQLDRAIQSLRETATDARAVRTTINESTLAVLGAVATHASQLPAHVRYALHESQSSAAGATTEGCARVLHVVRATIARPVHTASFLTLCERALADDLDGEDELAHTLAPVIARQWATVLLDARLAIERLATLGIALGTACFTGRLALLAPIAHLGTVVARIGARRHDDITRVELTRQDVARVGRAALLLFVSSRVLAIAESYAAVGGLLLALGSGALVLGRCDDSTVRALAPVVDGALAPIFGLVAAER